MTTPNPELNTACAHSIVAHSKISGSEPGTVRDAWACCDCGARFSRDLSLPMFTPEPSHLHAKVSALCTALAASDALVETAAGHVNIARMQLAACGVVAHSGKPVDCDPEYRTDSLDAVERMAARVAELEQTLATMSAANERLTAQIEVNARQIANLQQTIRAARSAP